MNANELDFCLIRIQHI